MKKPDLLRAAIVARNPDLKNNPEKLAVFIRSGSVSARYSTEAKGYQYSYPLTIHVRDFAGSVDHIVMPVLLWVRDHQPDLLLNHTSAEQVLNLSVDFLDAKTVDIDLTLNLTESTTIIEKPGGAFDLKAVPEPPIAGTDTFAGVPPMTALDFLASLEAQPDADNG
ncbi:phage tail protein [Asticcacaulis sp. BYS171W]|uniref:Phage tail protein n=1 Tax=Asticcacaulis aquaticus TaxID=2984212 RepID=A0ABT5HTA6_9CAUL|nr:phage tail protein [Asticcacaulis aquaticus]